MKCPKQVVDAYIMPIVESALNSKHGVGQPQDGSDDDSAKTLLDYLVSHTEGNCILYQEYESMLTWTLDPALIRDTLLAFLLAGRDTVRENYLADREELIVGGIQSASLLTFVTYVLALYPDVYQRLEAEINEVSAVDDTVTFDDIKHMRYCMSRICYNRLSNSNRTLRLNSTRSNQ